MTTTSTKTPRRFHHLRYAAAVTPLLRWLIAHHTVPADQPWRTRCDTCTAAVRPAACTPAGRCRTCRARIGSPPYLVEVVAVTAFSRLLASGLRGWELAAYTSWSFGLIILTFIDANRWRIRVGAPWRGLPAGFTPCQTVYGLFRRWQRDVTWDVAMFKFADPEQDRLLRLLAMPTV